MAVLFSDTFTRADNSSLGGNWSGSASIVSNAARLDNFGVTLVINTSSLGTANYEVQAEITQDGLTTEGSAGLGLVARYQDSNNFYLAWIAGNATTFVLYRVSGGGYTDIGNWSTSALSDPVTLKLSVNGTAIKVYVNGTQQISATDSTHTTEGDFGMRGFDPAQISAHRFDNFQVIDFAGATTYKDLTGTAAGAAGVSVSLKRKRALSGTSVGVAALTASLKRKRALTGASAGVATTTGTATRKRPLTGLSVGTATTVASLTRKRALTGVAAGVAVATGFVDKAGAVIKFLYGAATGQATTSSSLLNRRVALTGTSNGQATTYGAISKTKPFRGVVWMDSDHFEMIEPGLRVVHIGIPVLWDGGHDRFEMSGEFEQVSWNDPAFETADE